MYSSYSQREVGLISESIFSKTARNSHFLVTRLDKSGTLKGHTGCVNSICWNESGTRLVSGSDDCHLNFYDFTSRTIWHRIHTSHLSNIFSAKFLPWSNDLGVASCAGMGSVEYSQLSPDGEYVGHEFHCQTSLTYQVATIPASPNVFLTCEEKGYVRLFDLRTKSSCHCQGCLQDVLYDFPSAVTCMAVHPLSPHYIAIAVGDGIVRLLDRRKVGVAVNETTPSDQARHSTHFKYHADRIGTQPHKITSVQFNHVGSELLVSYSEDYVYLFNSSLFGTGMNSSSIPKPICVSDSFSPLICCRKKDLVRKKPPSSYQNIQNPDETDTPRGQSSSNEEPPPVKKFRLRGDWSDTGPDARPEGSQEQRGRSRLSQGLMSRMSQMFARWIDISLSPEGHEGGENHDQREGMREQDVSLASSSSSNDSSFNLFDSEDPERIREDEQISRRKESEKKLSIEQGNSEANQAVSALPGSNMTNSSNNEPPTLACHRDPSKSPVEEREANTVSVGNTAPTVPSSNAKESQCKAPMINIIEGETDSDDEEDKSCDPSGDQKSDINTKVSDESVRTVQQEYTDCLRPFMLYKGHRNSRTMIKQASFWGDNWILSGSDCGRMFVWDKWSGNIVNMLDADSHVVNCIQPHPHAYLLATSGIDYDIKLWEPTASVACCLDNMDEVVERNETMLKESRNTVTVPSMFVFRILSYLNRRRRMHRESEEEDPPND